MAEDLKKTEAKIAGQRKAIRDHIAKYERYPAAQDKAFAVKTIERVQDTIRDLKRRQPRASSSYEDTWKPPRR
ncbi:MULTISPECIES: hypothetical protein [Aeromicrobium]|uniref:hypothetical protein n=1 Tax=Aeromicrobium TaxID=2040 RepID=UPI00257E2F66|nr:MULTISPECIES: hypothetical protein [Aeromicrobium]